VTRKVVGVFVRFSCAASGDKRVDYCGNSLDTDERKRLL
jgi:hypothetical protein